MTFPIVWLRGILFHTYLCAIKDVEDFEKFLRLVMKDNIFF